MKFYVVGANGKLRTHGQCRTEEIGRAQCREGDVFYTGTPSQALLDTVLDEIPEEILIRKQAMSEILMEFPQWEQINNAMRLADLAIISNTRELTQAENKELEDIRAFIGRINEVRRISNEIETTGDFESEMVKIRSRRPTT